MKKSRFIMIFCLAVPFVLLAALAGWMIQEQMRVKTVSETKVSSSVTENSPTAAPGLNNSLDQETRITNEDFDKQNEIIIEPEQPAKPLGDGESTGTDEQELEQDPVTLLFGGDVYLSNHVLNAYDKNGGIHGVLDLAYLDLIAGADIFMVNQEFPFSNRGNPVPDKSFTFRLPVDRAKIMSEMDIDIVTLANNHALDYGREALLDTFDILDQLGIPYVGAGSNLDRAKKLVTMEAGDKTIGFLGASRVVMDANWTANHDTSGLFLTYDPALLLKEIQAAQELCDYLVVYVHWGIERETMPKDYQRSLGQSYIDAGADLVVGSHPHVLQGIEYYKNKPIIYSLGNFVFGSSIPKTALLQVELDGEEAKLVLIPGTSGKGYTRMLTDPEEKKEFYRYMEEISFGVTYGDDGQAYAQP